MFDLAAGASVVAAAADEEEEFTQTQCQKGLQKSTYTTTDYP
jgi:hypothetical protein